MSQALKEMLEAAEKFIHSKMLGSSDELTPIFDLRDINNNSFVIATPFYGGTPSEVDSCKDAVASFIRNQIIKRQITHYMFISEAWAIKRATYIPGITIRPSQADDRTEVVIAIATDGITHLSSSWTIKRDGSTCTQLIPSELRTVRLHGNSGRFDNLLKPERLN
jgi:hypothetical protein